MQLMSDVIDSDGFRANVGIVLMRGAGDVFLGRQVGGRGWQFPQGGVLTGERLEQAVYRELYEEIGLSPSDVELIGQTSRWLRYASSLMWTPALLGHGRKTETRGRI